MVVVRSPKCVMVARSIATAAAGESVAMSPSMPTIEKSGMPPSAARDESRSITAPPTSRPNKLVSFLSVSLPPLPARRPHALTAIQLTQVATRAVLPPRPATIAAACPNKIMPGTVPNPSTPPAFSNVQK